LKQTRSEQNTNIEAAGCRRGLKDGEELETSGSVMDKRWNGSTKVEETPTLPPKRRKRLKKHWDQDSGGRQEEKERKKREGRGVEENIIPPLPKQP
jgi:hypothetical protein